MAERPLALLLLPRPLEDFALREQVEELLRAPGVVAADPPAVPYGALLRLPEPLAAVLAAGTARRLLRRLPGEVRAVAIFEAAQWPLASALLAAQAEAELWYGGRSERPAGAGRRVERLDEQAEGRAALTFAAASVASALRARLRALGLG